jgi:nucleotide-binding universal stress UspA family protein
VYAKILVGTDGSRTAAKAVDRAVEVASASGAQLTICTAARPEHGQEVVESEAARHARAGVAIDTLVVDADPTTALRDTATAGGYDLLVVGNKGMTGARRLVTISPVPGKLSHSLPCSLLIVRTT